MSSISERADLRSRRTPRPEPRQPDFVVRAKSGPNVRDWTTIGVAWKRQNGDGYSISLKATPFHFRTYTAIFNPTRFVAVSSAHAK